jgi:DNA polymerase III delta prime subunit
VRKKRECENWLKTFLDWTMPVSEAPTSLLTWTGLFCISAVLKNKVRISKEYTKKYDVMPHTYIIFVGPPGVVRKSTSAGYAQELIVGMNEGLLAVDSAYVHLGPTSGSHVAIIDKMSNNPGGDGSMTIISGEFGNIVSTMPEETYDLFAKLFDTDASALRLEHSTRAHKDEVVLEPNLNLLGCTTPDWIMQNTGYMLGGGFAARTVFVFEYKARQRRLFYKKIGPSNNELDKMKKGLIKDLAHIGQLTGGAEPENEELADRMEAWYQGYVDTPAEKGAETFQARKHIHTLRTAIVLSVCERDDLIITGDHFDQAIKLIDDVESKLSRGLSSMGRNPYSSSMYVILEHIEKNGPVEEGKVLAYFFNDIPIDEQYKIFEVLKVSGQIERVDVVNQPPLLRMKK